jgi:hypothetical protein
VCAHGKQKSQCKECGGGSICPHGRYNFTLFTVLRMPMNTTV